MDIVREGQIIAYLENSTTPTNVTKIDSLLKVYNPNNDDILNILQKLPHNFSLGELNVKYYSFVNAVQEFSNYKLDRLYDKQDENLRVLLHEQNNAITTATKRIEMAKNNLDYAYKFFKRDSILFTRKVISEAEFDKTEMSFLSNKDALQNLITNSINARQTLKQTESKLQELGIQKPEKEKELRIALISAYHDLLDNIKNWEQKFVFKSPFNGKVQFLKFYRENQFVQNGEQVFTIVPKEEKSFGQLILPATGSGKIKAGQEVIVKLDNYPFMEYGTIEGRVKSISLTTNITKTDKADIETYMILVDFPAQLKTNYGAKLDFKAEATGVAEIITNDQRLLQRLFGNLRYILNK
ncbi:HlyD family secretion protein [Pedobacter sp. KBW01]|uniref:HlyD family secretion protein n=1 Tax=Pedobacter sp. KBW01 TaxID=2153364 RepID=UPI001319E813|nr:HlyD family secretion protein [Pedobacter sp. KBW01]